MKKQSKSMGWLLKTAVASVPLVLWGATASAQYRVQNNDGRALDANPRLGSGGYNSGSDLPAPVSGNNIVTGNVTGLRYFHGRVDYTDPRAFRGNDPTIEDPSDALIRTAGDAPTPDNTAPQFQPQGRVFYGDGRMVPPPPDYKPIAPGTPGYIPSQQIQPRSVGDARLGDISHGSVVDTPETNPLVLQGPLDQQGQPSIITASPLFGIRPEMAQDQSLLPSQDTANLLGLDDATLARMRAELGNSAAAADQNQPAGKGTSNNLSLTGPLNNQAPGTAVQNQSVSGQALSNAIGEAGNQGIQQKFIVPPQDQNSQYAQLLKQYQQMESENKLSPQERVKAYNDVMRERTREQQAAQSGTNQPAAGAAPGAILPAPGTAENPKTPGAKPAESEEKGATEKKPAVNAPVPTAKQFQPVQVNSFAEGMKGKGLANLTKQAEDLVRDGKFNAALDKYDAAEQVAPNNPMVKMGRAIAELGGSYYARADLHLRDAYLRSPALMTAKFNLANLLGHDRVQSLVRDLRDLATKEKKDSRPVFLLAFIAYNTGSPDTASAYLDLAEKRADNRDPLFKTLQSHWSIPEQKPQPAK
jgi:hypothetical protein